MSMLQLAQELAFIDTAFEQQFTIPKPDQMEELRLSPALARRERERANGNFAR